jgi:large repetitive protein
VHGRELWRSDGSAGGTWLVDDLNPGAIGSGAGAIRPAGGLSALFAASGGPDGVEVWLTDGTARGTHQLAEVAPGGGSSNPQNFTAAGDRVFFVADDGTTGAELWSLPAAAIAEQPVEQVFVPLIGR